MINFIAIDAVRASTHPTVLGGIVVHLFKEKTSSPTKNKKYSPQRAQRKASF